MIGLEDHFAGNGPYEELIGQHGLQSEQIFETVMKFLEVI
jgi:transketolase C-terminal domain/subunit